MSMRNILVRFAAVTLFGAGLALSAAIGTVRAPAAAPVAATAGSSPVVAPLLVVTLPTINVHAMTSDGVKTRQRQALLAALPKAMGSNANSGAAPTERTASTLPPLRLDMPYYSFGKTTSRLGKD